MNEDYHTSYQLDGTTSNSDESILAESIPPQLFMTSPIKRPLSQRDGAFNEAGILSEEGFQRNTDIPGFPVKYTPVTRQRIGRANKGIPVHRPDLLARHMHRHETQGGKAYIPGDPYRGLTDSNDSTRTSFEQPKSGSSQPINKTSLLNRGNSFHVEYHGKEEIRSKILTHLASITQKKTSGRDYNKFSVTFLIDWDVEKFMKEQFGGVSEKRIGSVIAITGSALCAEATTVENYLKRCWPESGQAFLEFLQGSLDSGALSAGQTHIAFPFLGTNFQIVEFAQQFAWLGSALQTSPSVQVGCSQCQLSVIEFGDGDVSWEMKFLVTPILDKEISCWNKLFSNVVIAYNFPIAARGFGKGLEIPINMMAALGGASQAVDFEGGLVLKGFSSMFVPQKFSEGSIQWHFEINEDDSRLPYWEVDERCPDRALLNELDWKTLTTARSFLGWWGSTTCHLGTSDANYENLDWSDTKEPERSFHFDGGSLGFQNMLVGELNFSPGLKDGKLHISRTGPYQQILKYARRTPIVLYDTCEKRAWLVPSSAVIAHIAQTRHFREPFSIGDKLVQMEATDSTLNIHEGAEKMLWANFPLKLYQGELGMGDFYFRDLVLNIWTILESLMDSNTRKESARKPVLQNAFRTNLKGWEFMDVVDERSPIRLKETCIQKSNGGWIDLATDINAVVLFASGFEDLIQPALSQMVGLCHKWKRVPKDKDYLAVSVAVLNNLHDEAGSRLTRKHLTSTHLQWNRGKFLFEPCADHRNYQCSCDRLQQIFQESVLTFGEITPPGPLQKQGAVIFGQNEHPVTCVSFPTRPTVENTLYKQVNVPFIQKDRLGDLKDTFTKAKNGECCATAVLEEINTPEKENAPSGGARRKLLDHWKEGTVTKT